MHVRQVLCLSFKPNPYNLFLNGYVEFPYKCYLTYIIKTMLLGALVHARYPKPSDSSG